MEVILSGHDMKKIDEYTINTSGKDALALMDNAAYAVYEEIAGDYGETAGVRFICVCGNGNNGADGIAIANLLKKSDRDVSIVIKSSDYHGNVKSREWLYHMEIAQKLGINLLTYDMWIYDTPYDTPGEPEKGIVLVDAIFGTGLTRKPEGIYKTVIEKINSAGAKKVYSVDMPSGVSFDTCVIADKTVTFGNKKTELVMYPGRTCCGEIIVKDIGFSADAYREENIGKNSVLYSITKEDLSELPARNPAGNKGDFGKCLVAGGSIGMCGAPYFTGKAAYRMGVGLVRVHTCMQNLISLQILLPEAVFSAYDSRPDPMRLENDVKWADTVAAGPGLGVDERAYVIIDNIISLCEKYGKPLILDADGLNVISANAPLREKLKGLSKIKPIITPHPGEMSRLTNKDISYIKAHPIETALECAKDYGVICVLKDAVTVITDGDDIYVSTSGNDGMATAGSGDVLAGILLGTVTSYKHTEYDNLTRIAALGTYIHGMAGDEAAKSTGKRSMMAADIIEEIKTVIP